ncbi:hypothetical protein [uncultured Thiothrix sp.]|uniref:hypothetical protein n=1 Tax=uncultured Thiothrix sp. TaxID=223185 RepID=UPI0026385983|nr:hypothetical protein [uncultured Thiothrix sp.]
MLNSSGNPLRIALLSISPHNRAILEFFFAGAGKQLFKVTSLADAETLIIDFDHPGADLEWQDRTETAKPGIILSVREIQLPNTIWVPKPLTSQALTKAAEQVRALLPKGATANTEREYTPPSTSQPAAQKPPTAAHPFGLGQRKTRPSQLLDFGKDDADTITKTKPAVTEKPSAPTTTKEPVKPIIPAKSLIRDPAKPTPVEEATDNSFLNFGAIALPEKNQEQLERRWQLLCGTQADVNPANAQTAMQRFTPDNFLLKLLLNALQQAKQSGTPIQLKFDTYDQILLLPNLNMAYCSFDLTSDKFATLCNTPIQAGKVHLHTPTAAEMPTLEQAYRADKQHTHDLESILWLVTLLASHGRLNRDVNINQRWVVKHWPNLTRVENIPHVMRIAAAWQQRPGTVFDVAKWLDIPQRHVFAFFTAASVLGLMAMDEGKVEYQEKEVPQKNRGLFSRLLKRLLGGGGN